MKDIIFRKGGYPGKSMVYFLSRFAKRAYVADFSVFFLYAIVVILVTWPLIINMKTTIPGLGNDGGDGFIFLWNLWWVKKQFLLAGDFFFTKYIYYPLGVNLVFHTLTLGQSLLGAVVGLIFSPVQILNGIFLFFMWLSAVFGYLLARDLWKNRFVALFSGLIFAFSPYLLSQARGHFNLTAIWPFPALTWLWLRSFQKNNLLYSILTGLILAFLCLNDWQYFVFGLILFFFLLLYAFSDEGGKSWKKFILWMISIAVAALIFVPFLIKSFLVADGYLPKALLSEVTYWSADIISFFIPSNINTFFGEIGNYFGNKYYGVGIESQLYLGWIVIGFFLLSFFLKKEKKDRPIYFWQVMTIIFALLALGPLLKVFGKTQFFLNDTEFTVALPYMLLYKVPFLDTARVPSRFVVLLMMCLAVVFAWVVKKIIELIWLSVNFPKYLRGGLIVLFVLIVSGFLFLEYSSWPMIFQRIYIPEIYKEIKNDPDEFTVLELPLWWASGHRAVGDQKTIIQYWQTYHEKRILNGSVSRVPDAVFDYYLEKPGIKYLIDVENNILENRDKDKLLVEKTWVDDLGVKYIVVHKKYYTDDNYYAVRAYLENVLGYKVWYEDQGELGYKIV